MQSFLRDLSYTLRQLRRSPGFALTTVLTLTLAIAANVVVFGILNALIFHSLPIPHPQQVFQIQGHGGMDLTKSYPDYRDIRDRNKTFSDVAIIRLTRIGLGIKGTAQPVFAYETSGNYFRMLGIQPLLGRFFQPEDDVKVNGSPVAVISYSSWRVRFSGDSHIIGKTVQLNKHPYTIIGVAPKGFSGTERFIWPELWVPYHNIPELDGWNPMDNRDSDTSWVAGRLKPGITPAQADADLTRVASQLATDYPKEDKGITLCVTQIGLLGDVLGKPVRAFLSGIMGMAFLVLLAACANLGGVFAARTADRARELGIRIAIGSSRATIIRQLLTESVTIALIGGAAATLLSATLLRALTHWQPANLTVPVQFLVEPDLSVYLFAALIALITGLLFGLIPARQVWKTDPNETLKASGTTGLKEHRFSARNILLVVQIALCCLLVTASFVAVRGLQRTFTMPLGFNPDNVTLATLDLHLAGYPDTEVLTMQKKLADSIARIPGVSGVAFSNNTPLSIDDSNTGIFPPGTTDFGASNTKFYAQFYAVSSSYFTVAGTHLLYGRAFTEHDDTNAPKVAIINETFAKSLFGTANAVGKSYPTGPHEQIEVVGVVEDGKYESLTEDLKPALFRPILQESRSDTSLLVRSNRSPSEILPAVRQAIASVDSSIPLFSLGTWSDALSLQTFPARAATVALGILGTLAIMLSITGIFGLANYTVSRRMRELGIRVALGAQNRQVLRTAMGRVVWLLAMGSCAGLLLGIGTGKLLSSIVYQATAADPVVILAVVLAMALLGLVSALVPARRAIRVNPAILLRDE